MTHDKVNFYFVRTVEHIHRVQSNMLSLVTKHYERLALTDEQRREAMFNVMKHDRSKFSTAQFEPYIELTEYYRQKRYVDKDYEYAPGVRGRVDAAVQNHYQVENHHAEKFASGLGKYNQLEALEVVCDLQAMAQEFNEGSCRAYYENVWRGQHLQYFYDDYNWACVEGWMKEAIACFEEDLEATT